MPQKAFGFCRSFAKKGLLLNPPDPKTFYKIFVKTASYVVSEDTTERTGGGEFF
jgi:hypothetical protein